VVISDTDKLFDFNIDIIESDEIVDLEGYETPVESRTRPFNYTPLSNMERAILRRELRGHLSYFKK
jgi:hypothetical protein